MHQAVGFVFWPDYSQINSDARCPFVSVIRPKRIYFLEHFCYCFSYNLCVLNATNTNSCCFQQNCSGVLFLCRNLTFRKNPEKYCKNSILPEDPRSQKERRRGAVAWAHHQGRGPALAVPTYGEAASAIASTPPSAYIYPLT
jgi:hypothetical protein